MVQIGNFVIVGVCRCRRAIGPEGFKTLRYLQGSSGHNYYFRALLERKPLNFKTREKKLVCLSLLPCSDFFSEATEKSEDE